MKFLVPITFLTGLAAAQQVPVQPAASKLPSLAEFGKVPIPKGCSKYELIIGTNEPGSFGIITGDPLIARVKEALPDARGYAVQYPADRTPESPEIGALDVVNRLRSQTAACPDQTFALVGCSQGARTIRKATARPDWDANWNDKIVAVVTYGDPGQRVPVPRPAPGFPTQLVGKTKLNCAKGDSACDSTAKTNNYYSAHLTYNSPGTTWQAESSSFVIAGFLGKELPQVDNAPR